MVARALVLVLVAIACAPAVTPSASPAPASLPATKTTTAPASASATPRAGPAVVERIDVIARGLEAPWAIDLAPDGRLFLTERPGRIRVIKDGALMPAPWAALPAAAEPNKERGLLGLALDPDFATSPFVYVYFTYVSGSGRLLNRLVRMRDEDGRGVEDKVLLDGIVGNDVHDGGRVKFGPGGKLYLTVGEANNGGLAQDLRSPNGKILRLERDGSVPADNPFPGSYVWSFGHRNPQGLAWDASGRLYATEHGPSGDPRRGQPCCHDEVNRIEPGVNYGWPSVWGIARDPRFRDPVLESGDDTWAPSGAAFVRDGTLAGSLLFAALRGQHLHRVVFASDGRSVLFEERLLVNQFGRLRDVFMEPSGSFLVLTSNRDGRGSASRDDDRVLRVTLR